MTAITIEGFSGIAPKVPAINLGNSLAQVASNVRLERRSLLPMRETKNESVTLGANSRTIYNYLSSGWIEFAQRTYISRLPVIDDVLERIVLTDEDYPRYAVAAAHIVLVSQPLIYHLWLPQWNHLI